MHTYKCTIQLQGKQLPITNINILGGTRLCAVSKTKQS